ncbi:MAG: hypothetical protein Q9219_002256, partial [cf. Caloplaca sp. 3 TL-2023]
MYMIIPAEVNDQMELLKQTLLINPITDPSTEEEKPEVRSPSSHTSSPQLKRGRDENDDEEPLPPSKKSSTASLLHDNNEAYPEASNQTLNQGTSPPPPSRPPRIIISPPSPFQHQTYEPEDPTHLPKNEIWYTPDTYDERYLAPPERALGPTFNRQDEEARRGIEFLTRAVRPEEEEEEDRERRLWGDVGECEETG